jgi:mannonate dehydratase
MHQRHPVQEDTMIRITAGVGDLTDSHLRRITQLGVDAVDLGEGRLLPGVKERGYPDLDEMVKIKKRVRSWGLEINRATLPDISESFMKDEAGTEQELDNAVRSLKVIGDAGLTMAAQRFEGSNFNHLVTFYRSEHRGGYLGSGGSVWRTGKRPPDLTPEELEYAQTGAGGRVTYWPRFAYDEPPGREQLEEWWSHFRRVYDRLVPIAEEYGIRLGTHPSDIPLPDTPFGSLGFHRIIDAYPSRNVGYIYCCGTRAEAGGLPLVLDEIHNYGRKGRIFMVHFRNVRGSLATAGGYEEVLLDDGDMNMFKILMELRSVGFDGYLNPDHMFPLEGDSADGEQALAYSVGYIKGLLASLAVV